MKKILIILLALLLPASLMATPLIQVGGTAFYNNTVTSEDFTDGLTDFSNFGLGVEVRLNLFDWVSIAVPATIGFGDVMTYGTQPSINLNLPVAGFFDLALGVGTKLDFAHQSGTWLVNGTPIDNFGDAFANANMTYRAAATFNLGFLGVGLAATIPTDGTFSDFDASPNWEETTVSASVLFNLF